MLLVALVLAFLSYAAARMPVAGAAGDQCNGEQIIAYHHEADLPAHCPLTVRIGADEFGHLAL
jgi:hypothetical protein